MFQSQKNVFWEALLVTILIFGIGVFMGVVLENWRVSKIEYSYQHSEIRLMDIKAQGEIYSLGDFDCKTTIQENLNFADSIYKEAEVLSRYEGAERLTEALKLEHQKYDILRALLWTNSIKIKKQCNASYYNLVYLYEYKDLSIDTVAKQSVFSRILFELKQKKADKIMLIPIAGDNDLYSVSLLMSRYNVTESELPVILIDEKIKITELQKVEEIEKLLK